MEKYINQLDLKCVLLIKKNNIPSLKLMIYIIAFLPHPIISSMKAKNKAIVFIIVLPVPCYAH